MINKNLQNQVTIIILATDEETILENTIKVTLEENKEYICEICIITPDRVSKGCLDTIKKVKLLFGSKISHQYQPSEYPGYGGASIYGISLVKTDYFIFLDADGETDPFEVKNLIYNLENTSNDIISCSRWLSSNWVNQYGIINYILNWIFQKFTSLLYFSNLTDYTVGYRIYPTRTMKEMNFKNLNQSFSLETILIPIRKGLKIKEIPYNFIKRTEGQSENTIINKLKYIKTLFECRFRKL
tara:strand:- start:1094 stop:1819 length:726 start_codon:yes stop_codon:yes gene_type:complete